MMKHVFAICAYRESPYLESCIRSLKSQISPSEIILCTSTPSRYIDKLAEKYQIPVFVREGKSQIQDDWNFAYQMADGDLVTIAHQDDMYGKGYTSAIRTCWEQYPDTTVFMTDTAIVRGKRLVSFDLVNLIKKVLRIPLRFSSFSHYTWVKRSSLMFGNPIICPSCTYNKKLLKDPVFTSKYQFALDWDTMLKLAETPGRFISIERPLMYYRIHENATTRECIKNHQREQEEQELFKRLWPFGISKWILAVYRFCYKSYD